MGTVQMREESGSGIRKLGRDQKMEKEGAAVIIEVLLLAYRYCKEITWMLFSTNVQGRKN